MKSIPKNVPASVRTRLLNLSRDREEDFNLTLTRFVSERFLYRLGVARITLQIDIGFGDAVHPPPEALRIKTLLDHEAPEVLAYSLFTVIAEKLEAIVSVGMVTSRMKDFFDLYTIASSRRFDRLHLFESIQATFHRRGTPLPLETPRVLSEEMPQDISKQAQWTAFVRRIERVPSELPLDTVVSKIHDFTRIIWDRSLHADITMWTPEDGWHSV